MLPELRPLAANLWTVFVRSSQLRIHHSQSGNVWQKSGGSLMIGGVGEITSRTAEKAPSCLEAFAQLPQLRDRYQ